MLVTKYSFDIVGKVSADNQHKDFLKNEAIQRFNIELEDKDEDTKSRDFTRYHRCFPQRPSDANLPFGPCAILPPLLLGVYYDTCFFVRTCLYSQAMGLCGFELFSYQVCKLYYEPNFFFFEVKMFVTFSIIKTHELQCLKKISSNLGCCPETCQAFTETTYLNHAHITWYTQPITTIEFDQ